MSPRNLKLSVKTKLALMLPHGMCYTIHWGAGTWRKIHTGRIRAPWQKQNKTKFAGVENYRIFKNLYITICNREIVIEGKDRYVVLKSVEVGMPVSIASPHDGTNHAKCQFF